MHILGVESESGAGHVPAVHRTVAALHHHDMEEISFKPRPPNPWKIAPNAYLIGGCVGSTSRLVV